MNRWASLGAVILFFCASVAFADQFNHTYFTGDGSLPDLMHEVNGAGAKDAVGKDPTPNPIPKDTPPDPDTDGDGVPDSQDPDIDGDGVPNGQDPDPTNPDEKATEETAGAKEAVQQPNDPNPGPVVEDEEDILDILLGEGGILGISSLGGVGGGANIDFGSLSTSGGFSIVMDGRKVRDAFGNSLSVKDILKFWKKTEDRQKRGARLSTGEYYALVAAELAMDDARLDGAAFSATQFQVTYRSRGSLFAFIPISFPVLVTVTMSQTESDVAVKLPWYHSFVREYFTRDSLASEIKTVVEDERKIENATEALQLRMFTAVANFLRQKVRTISDSIILGS